MLIHPSSTIVENWITARTTNNVQLKEDIKTRHLRKFEISRK